MKKKIMNILYMNNILDIAFAIVTGISIYQYISISTIDSQNKVDALEKYINHLRDKLLDLEESYL